MFDEFTFTLTLKCNDDECDKDIDEEERENDEVHDVKDGHLHAIARLWAAIFKRCINRISQDPKT